MRILIADDQVRVRQALRVLLAQQPGVRVIGEAADGEELLAQIRVKAADRISEFVPLTDAANGPADGPADDPANGPADEGRRSRHMTVTTSPTLSGVAETLLR
jgi:hypothetical protein